LGRHLIIGIAANAGTLTYHRFAHATLNTIDPKTAEAVARTKVATERVVGRPLSYILDLYAPGQHLDLLSVDAEGLDLVVLRRLAWQGQRPTAICLEDTPAYELGVAGRPQFSSAPSARVPARAVLLGGFAGVRPGRERSVGGAPDATGAGSAARPSSSAS